MISTPKTCPPQIWGSSTPRPPSCNSPWPAESSRSINLPESFPRPVPEAPLEPVRKKTRKKETHPAIPCHSLHQRLGTGPVHSSRESTSTLPYRPFVYTTPGPAPYSSPIHYLPHAHDLTPNSLTVAGATGSVIDFGTGSRCASPHALYGPRCCSIEHTGHPHVYHVQSERAAHMYHYSCTYT